jgi:SEC-C motif-containing protein
MSLCAQVVRLIKITSFYLLIILSLTALINLLAGTIANASLCPCGCRKKYLDCCEPFLSGRQKPKTPEDLMRSRYTAYTLAEIDYIKKTMRGKPLLHFQETEARRWASRLFWLQLKVLRSTMETPTKGYVEFIAQYIDGTTLHSLHEKSEFSYEQEQWFYVDGFLFPTKKQLISRNNPCPCGSQRKFKNCHGNIVTTLSH